MRARRAWKIHNLSGNFKRPPAMRFMVKNRLLRAALVRVPVLFCQVLEGYNIMKLAGIRTGQEKAKELALEPGAKTVTGAGHV